MNDGSGKGGPSVSGEVLGIDDPDIGMCDLCGTEDGRRFRTILVRTYEGEPRRVMTWLCGSCKRAERQAQDRQDATTTCQVVVVQGRVLSVVCGHPLPCPDPAHIGSEARS